MPGRRPPLLTRRSLLEAMVALAATRSLVACSAKSSDGGTSPTTSGKDVVVLGGGLSGLCTAYELRKKGYNVVAVLEAQARTGGRVLTLREGLANGQYAEAGATRIADTHNFTLAYANQFGIPLREFTSGDAQYFIKGKSFVKKDADAWPKESFPALTDEERTMGADSVVLNYEKLDELGDPLKVDWPTAKALDYNDMTIVDYLKSKGASDDVITLDNAINGSELAADGALYWLMADVVDAKWDKTFAMQGGNDQLPKAFTKDLGDLVKYESPVKSLKQDDSSVTVTFTAAGLEKSITADLAVCALPFTTLRKLDLAGAAFTADKTRLVSNLSMMPVSRFYAQTKSRFWKSKGVGGLKVARTDTAIERLWHVTDVQDGDSGILLAYLQNQNGLAFQAQAADKRVDYAKKLIAQFWPEIEAEYTGSVQKIWQEDPWAGGAWGYYKKGEMKQMFPLAKQRQGRVFFCGEHTSAWSGWMQGALESANRVVAEITGG